MKRYHAWLGVCITIAIAVTLLLVSQSRATYSAPAGQYFFAGIVTSVGLGDPPPLSITYFPVSAPQQYLTNVLPCAITAAPCWYPIPGFSDFPQLGEPVNVQLPFSATNQ